jgi:hypothetical protein
MYWSVSHIRLTCKYIWIPGQSALRSMIESNNNRSAFKARPLGPHKVMSISTHYDDLWGYTQLAISVPDWCKGLTSDHTYSQRTNAYKKEGAPDWRLLTSILCFLHVQYYVQKARGSRSMSLNIYLMFFTYATSHTKTRGSRLTSFNIYLILFTRTALHTKSKGLLIDVP